MVTVKLTEGESRVLTLQVECITNLATSFVVSAQDFEMLHGLTIQSTN